MPFLNDNQYLNIDWNTFFKDINTKENIPKKLKQDIKQADLTVRKEFYLYLLKDIEFFYNSSAILLIKRYCFYRNTF